MKWSMRHSKPESPTCTDCKNVLFVCLFLNTLKYQLHFTAQIWDFPEVYQNKYISLKGLCPSLSGQLKIFSLLIITPKQLCTCLNQLPQLPRQYFMSQCLQLWFFLLCCRRPIWNWRNLWAGEENKSNECTPWKLSWCPLTSSKALLICWHATSMTHC